MNVTVFPACRAVFLMMYLYFITLSAVANSVPYRMSTYEPAPPLAPELEIAVMADVTLRKLA